MLICNGISRNLDVTLPIKEQGTCLDEVANICKDVKDQCHPTLTYTEDEVYRTLCEVVDCKRSKAAQLCRDKCSQSNYTFILYLELPISSFLLGDITI